MIACYKMGFISLFVKGIIIMKHKLSAAFIVSILLTGCGPDSPLTIIFDEDNPQRIALHQHSLLKTTISSNKGNNSLVWTSSNPLVFEVTQEGIVTPIAIGEASITVAIAGKSAIKDTIDLSSYCLVDEIDELKNVAPHYETLPAYTPVRFKEDSWSVSSKSPLADGADLVEVALELNSGKKVAAHILEVDLTKSVNIVAGSYNNLTSLTGKKQNLYSQILAYQEKNPDMKVVGATNADFFGNFPVNAFVKDNLILQDSHLDNGGYDYTNTNNDIPASMPMLFGVNNQFAQVGAIIDNVSVERTIKSKLTYELHAIDNYGAVIETYNDVQRNVFSLPDNSRVNLITSSSREAKAPANATVYTIKPHDEGYLSHGEITSVEKVTAVTTISPSTVYHYAIVPEAIANPDISVGNFIAYNVASEDGKWNHYQQILGARQELVVDGQIPHTVTLENTNGAQTTNVPRTAVGIMENGKVALFAIESLYYGKKATSEDDTYGVNLPELAEIMRYYGCVNAGNFDGGGSTQMIVHRDDIDEVVVRSSDFGTYGLEDGRSIINSVLIVKEK